MHKNFANTLFLGKRVFSLPQCHSTNELLLEKIKSNLAIEGDIITADFQSAGRGQLGSVWQSEPGKNLLFSVYLTPIFLSPANSFLLNVISALALVKTLSSTHAEAEFVIKWPNDIFVKQKKISGILTQTLVDRDKVRGAVVGVGLNVNQLHFEQEGAISLAQVAGATFDRGEALEKFIHDLEALYLQLHSGKAASIIRAYHDKLMWRGQLHRFRDRVSGEFEGEIVGIDQSGRLNIRAGDVLRSFGIKEVEYLE